MRVVLTGGGTGGHVLPFEPVIAALRTQFLEQKERLPNAVGGKRLDIYFVGVADKNTRNFFARYDVGVTNIPSGKIRRYISPFTITDLLLRLPLGFVLSLFHLYRLMPDAVISHGGYGSVPVALAAAFYRIPILLHEPDAVPGLANRKLARRASAITVGFAVAKKNFESKGYKVFVTGTPVRSGLETVSQAEAKQRFGFAKDEPVLLIMGGSQGAQQINEVLLQILPKLILEAAVLHITGEKNFDSVSKVAQELLASSSQKGRYKPFPYLQDQMTDALVAADSVVSRAGASTLNELIRLRKPTLIIPLDTAAQDHQRMNAHVLEAAGAAIVLDPTNLKQNLLEQNLRRLISDADTRKRLQENMAKIDKPNAARDIAQLAFQLAQGLAPVKEKVAAAPAH